MKTSAVAVRSVLRDGLEHPSGYQTARTGLAAPKRAIRLYRDGQGEDTSGFAASPFSRIASALREGGHRQRGGAGRPLRGGPGLATRPWQKLKVFFDEIGPKRQMNMRWLLFIK